MTYGNINYFESNDNDDLNYLNTSKNIILNSIKKINLDLSNLIVLTEAATGNWIFTPIIAAFANAKKVICITKDSQYGKSNDIKLNFKKITQFLKINEKIQVYSEPESKLISEADIITNSGLVRPIDKKFIDSMKETAVISLMWEPWEFRPEDIDLYECWKKQIPILGVNEHNSIMNIMKYDGEAIIKILNNANVSLLNKKIILVGENLSALYMYDSLQKAGANVFFVSQLLEETCNIKKIPIIGNNLNEEKVNPYLENSDLIIINSIPIKEKIIGGNGMSVEKLKQLSPNVSIFVYFGNVDYQKIISSGLKCFPSTSRGDGYMGWTVDVLGPKPTIELNSLGLKVGEILAKNRPGKTKLETENISLNEQFCLDFTEQQKNQYYKHDIM